MGDIEKEIEQLQKKLKDYRGENITLKETVKTAEGHIDMLQKKMKQLLEEELPRIEKIAEDTKSYVMRIEKKL